MEVAAETKEKSETALSNNKTEDKSPLPLPQEQQKKPKKEDRSRKDDRNVEQFMKSLNSVASVDEKFAIISKKYAQTAEENKKLQFYIKQLDKRYAMTLKEKEQLQYDFNKTILVKSKLENLCRELQKQNKAIKEESLLKIREEEERRKETQAKFQSTLGEITSLLQQNNDKNAKLRDDNITMSEKFKSIVSQYQLREQQVDKMSKQMALEQQLADAKMQKASLEHQAERGRLLADMETLKMEAAQNRAKVSELQSVETALRGQLAVYTDKYDEFQAALTKSNQVFGGFKGEMEKMSKKIQKLEKESLSWKTRWERTQAALVDMCSERGAADERARAHDLRLRRLQGLCRALQAERTLLHNTLKEHNIERPPLPALPPPPASPPPAANKAGDAKVDAMAANCAQLKQSLAHLQNQLNVLTTKPQTPEPAKPEPKKKSKSKKKKTTQTVTEANVEESSSNTEETVPAKKTVENGVEALVEAISKASINGAKIENTEVGLTEVKSEATGLTEVNMADLLDAVSIPEVTSEFVDLLEASSGVEELPEIDLDDLSADLGEDSFTQGVNDEIAHIEEVKPISQKAS